MAKLLKFLFIISVLPGFLFAQHKRYKFERISIEDGLSSPYVNCFLQDQQGFLWIGTPSGLNRFDGYQFKIYKHDPLDPTTISNNAITALYEDSLGHLWIGTGAGGLNKFDPITETFTSWQHDHGNSYSLCDNNIVTIHGSRDGGLWIGTLDGLARISNDYLYGNEQELSFRIFKHDSIDLYSLSHNFIKSIYEDKNGMVWIGTERGGLNRFDPTEEKFYHRFNANENDLFWKEKHSLPFVPVLCFYGDSSQEENIFWIGTAHGVFKYQLHLAKTTRYRPNNPGFIYEPKGHFHSLIKDRDGMLWIATRKNGILLFDEKKNDLISLKHDYTDPYSLSHNWISTLYQDRSGAIWVGTSGSGLCQYSPRRWKFKHYPLESDELAGKRNFSVTAIFEDLQEKGKILWIGAGDQGLLRYNRETNVIRRIYFKGRSNYFVNFLYQDPSNPANLWIACRGDGLLKLNKKSKLFTQYKLVSPEEEFQRNPNRKDLVSTSYLNTFIRDRNGHFWLASGLGVYRFDPQTTKFTPHLHDPENNNSLSDNYVKIVFEDDQGKLWFGTVFGGLDLFDPVNNKFIHFQNNPQDSLSISNNCITSIHQDKNGIMWIGTAVGLNRYDSTRTCFIRYGQKDGIAGETIWGILQDQQGNLWFTSGQGLTQFNPETGKCINYDLDDGLQGNDFNSLAYHQSRRGEMFYGGQNGFNAFFPDSLKKNDAIPRVVLTDLKIFNKSVKPGADSPLKQALTETLEIVLKHDQSIFSFEFAALDYTIPKKNKYAYQMEGVDPDWVYTDASRRFATYTQLSPGNYTFNVKASNNDGIWNEEGLSIRITILPPWWRTNWAYLAYFLTIGAVIAGVWRFQMNRLQLKHRLEMEHMETEKLQEIDHMKSRFFANISHEFRTPLTLILGPLSEMLMKKGEPSEKQGLKLMERSARRLQQLINQLLDLSKLESGKMILQVQETELLSFINRIVQSFESQAKIKRINLSFSTELKFAYAWIDNEKMENIMNNLLSNAFKFTNKGGRIEVGIKNIPLNPPSEADFTISPLEGELQGGVCITVSDTGRGIPLDNQDHIFDRFYQVDDSYSKDEEGSGIGLALTKELVDLHLGRIEVKSEVGIGSTFSIYLPLGKEHLRPEQVIESKTEKTDEEISLTDSPCLAVGQAFEEGVREMSATELPQEDYTRRVTEGVSESRHLLLVVEDNSDMRLYIRGNLENDYEIVEAEDGDAGYKVCIKSLPDLIISDVMMPKMDGFEFCQKVKSDERTSHIPLILLTARAEMTDKLGGLDQGADDYLTKPFNVIELRTRIRNILEQRRRLHTRFQREAATQPREIAVSSLDEQFLNRALNIIERHMDEPGFEVTNFAREMGISRAHLYNKLEALTGQSAKEFIRTVRLKRGAQLIRKKAGNISQIAYEVGFNNPSYFSHCFCSQFGLSPSEYARQDKN